MSTPRIKSSRLLLSWRGAGGKTEKVRCEARVGGEGIGQPGPSSHQGRGETFGPMGGQEGGQGPIRAGQCDSHTLGLGLAMMENHDPPLGKEQLDIRSQEPRQNSARIEI